MPIYTVRPKGEADPKKSRMVRADNAAQALRHVVKNTLEVQATAPDEAALLGAEGVRVEDAAA